VRPNLQCPTDEGGFGLNFDPSLTFEQMLGRLDEWRRQPLTTHDWRVFDYTHETTIWKCRKCKLQLRYEVPTPAPEDKKVAWQVLMWTPEQPYFTQYLAHWCLVAGHSMPETCEVRVMNQALE
jgi:hypothetical protein